MEIHRLPEKLSQKIAAGEVIERPLSVVKELMENSIDAGAKNIEVELLQGGKVLISVKDDGRGIAPEELSLAVEKHATSKISTEDDLESIGTLGYRGEALASVCAVSRLEIYSRRAALPEGASLHFDGGTPKVTRLPLCPGTVVTVKDLFYNLPARRKFLKSPAAEFRRIFRLVQDYAFAYPGIAFSLIHGGKTQFSSSGSGSVDALLASIWGEEPRVRSAESRSPRSGVSLWWQDMGPQSKLQLISFVNGRRVSDAVIRSAITAFNWAGRGNWLIMLTLPTEDVDVNVHPAKSEILFRHSSEVYDLIHRTAEELSRGFSEVAAFPAAPGNTARPQAFSGDFDVRPKSVNPSVSGFRAPDREPHPFSRMERPVFRAASPAADRRREGTTERLPLAATPQNLDGASANETEQSVDRQGRRYLGQLQKGYLIFDDGDGLLVVDPHAAHERINYERILKNCAAPQGRQGLIMPVPLPPTLKESALFHKDELSKLNFAVNDDGSLSMLPMNPKAAGLNPVELLRSAVSALEDRKDHSESLVELFASKACKASVKLTTRLEAAEALRLLEDLESCDQPNACPHGRPTVLRLTGSSLDKHFGRLGL
ncbi:MAG: DNA mismatch repair endonuclease MutL [Pyramidobacter sp.]|jgi:DNA mismatch repair protein MutL